MPSREDIQHQQGLLQIYRNNVALYERQKASHSSAYMPPSISNGLAENRRDIARAKQILRDWGVPVADQPTDVASPTDLPVRAPDIPTAPNDRQETIGQLLEHFDALEDEIRAGQQDDAIRHLRGIRRLLNVLSR